MEGTQQMFCEGFLLYFKLEYKAIYSITQNTIVNK
jgi:hypothetical protein